MTLNEMLLALVRDAEEVWRQAQIAEWRARGTAQHDKARARLEAVRAAVYELDRAPIEFPRGEPLTIDEEKLLVEGLRKMREREARRRLQGKYDVARH